MLVFRVERSDGMGPYSIAPGTNAQRSPNDPTGLNHPLPDEDEGLKGFPISSRHVFGFVSMEQLLEWWPKENHCIFAGWNKHSSLKYGISAYEVPMEEVEVGDKQLVFIKESSTRLSWDEFVMARIESR